MSTAQRIILIRHGEKPDTPPPYGIDHHGVQNIQCLTVHGWERAGALACLFAPSRGPLQSPLISTPAAIFASPPGGTGSDESQSQRPVETVTPLAKKLGIAIRTDFTKGQEAEVAQAAMAEQGVVLVCWQHKALPLIANAIVGNDTTVPQKWPGDRFDVVWIFDLQPGGGYGFSQLPQLLLAGDQSTVIS